MHTYEIVYYDFEDAKIYKMYEPIDASNDEEAVRLAEAWVEANYDRLRAAGNGNVHLEKRIKNFNIFRI